MRMKSLSLRDLGVRVGDGGSRRDGMTRFGVISVGVGDLDSGAGASAVEVELVGAGAGAGAGAVTGDINVNVNEARDEDVYPVDTTPESESGEKEEVRM